MSQESGRFFHRSLDDPDHQFRVVTILASSTDSFIKCKLSTVNLWTGKGTYAALSYLWGPPMPVQAISLNGQEFFVRENLWHFLRRASSHFVGQLIFIDAICIDQVNIPERNKQVQLMGDIYLYSTKVLSWLGEGNEKLDKALPLIQSISNMPVSDLERMNSGSDDEKRAKQQIWLGVYLLCDLRYWTRVWIVQEIIKPKDILLLYGTHELSWATLYSFLTKLRQAYPCPAPLPTELFTSRMAQFIDARRDSTDGCMDRPMRKILLMYGSSGCTDTHDCIYALISLPRPGVSQSMRVDYENPLSDLFMNMLQLWGGEGGANILILAKHMHNNLMPLPAALDGKEGDPRDLVLKLVELKRLEKHDDCLDTSKCCTPSTISIQLLTAHSSQDGTSLSQLEVTARTFQAQEECTALELKHVYHTQLRCDDIVLQLEDSTLFLVARSTGKTIEIAALLSIMFDEVDGRSGAVARWLPWPIALTKHQCNPRSRGNRQYELCMNAYLLRWFLYSINHRQENVEVIDQCGGHSSVVIESLSWERPDGSSYCISAVNQVQKTYADRLLLAYEDYGKESPNDPARELSTSQAHQALRSSKLDMSSEGPAEFMPTPSWKDLLGRQHTNSLCRQDPDKSMIGSATIVSTL